MDWYADSSDSEPSPKNTKGLSAIDEVQAEIAKTKGAVRSTINKSEERGAAIGRLAKNERIKYGNTGNTNVDAVQLEMDKLNSPARGAVVKARERGERLGKLEGESEGMKYDMKDSANRATAIRKKMQRRNLGTSQKCCVIL